MKEFSTGEPRIHVAVCEELMDIILEQSLQNENGKETCINIYDYKLRDVYPDCGMKWPPILPYMYSYLRVSPSPLSYFHSTWC